MAKGTIYLAGDTILKRIYGSLLSQKPLVKVRQFSGATITDMYDHFKANFRKKFRIS